MSYSAEEDGAGRRKLNLQPRGATADLPSSTSSAKSSKPNPFGAARPREQVIAEREGKRENEVLKEQAKKDWKPSIVLAESQREEKKAIEAELAFARSELEKEEDPVKVKSLRDEVSLKERKLEELLASFEKLAVRSAQTGGTRRSFDRRQEENPMSVPYAGAYGNRESAFTDEGYGNFRGRAREGGGGGGGRGASYGDTWGGTRGKSGQSECYTCGEVGHYSRDCPSGMGGPRGGSYGGTFGGGRGGGGGGGGGGRCYTCGQEGHFSRECPQGGGFGSRSGAYGAPPSYGAPYAGAYVGNYQPYDASGYGFAQAGGYSGNGYDTSYGSGRGGSYGGQGYRS